MKALTRMIPWLLLLALGVGCDTIAVEPRPPSPDPLVVPAQVAEHAVGQHLPGGGPAPGAEVGESHRH